MRGNWRPPARMPARLRTPRPANPRSSRRRAGPAVQRAGVGAARYYRGAAPRPGTRAARAGSTPPASAARARAARNAPATGAWRGTIRRGCPHARSPPRPATGRRCLAQASDVGPSVRGRASARFSNPSHAATPLRGRRSSRMRRCASGIGASSEGSRHASSAIVLQMERNSSSLMPFRNTPPSDAGHRRVSVSRQRVAIAAASAWRWFRAVFSSRTTSERVRRADTTQADR